MLITTGTAVVLIVSVSLIVFRYADAYKVERYELFMPDARPSKPETYLCTPVKVDVDKSYYIIGFEPKASMHVAHHMLLYGCLEPGSSRSIWNCGEMSSMAGDSNDIDEEEPTVPCKTNSSIIYAWAKDAPMLKLPKDVGFKVGLGSSIKYLVLQIHYAHVEPFVRDSRADTSGVYLYYTERPMDKLAGVLLLGSAGWIPPMSTESLETACNVSERKVLHPFAFRVHTHALGVEVAGYRVRNVDGLDHWTLLGRRDPQLPQMFYPIKNDVQLEYGDYVAASCKMASRRNRRTYIGSTADDEMCNFYLMYWTDDDSPLQTKYCFTPGSPFYYWRQQFNNLPLREEIGGDNLKY